MENLEKPYTYLDYGASRCFCQVTRYEQLKFFCTYNVIKYFMLIFLILLITGWTILNNLTPRPITTTSLKKIPKENMRKRRPIKTNKRKKRKAEEQLEQ